MTKWISVPKLFCLSSYIGSNLYVDKMISSTVLFFISIFNHHLLCLGCGFFVLLDIFWKHFLLSMLACPVRSRRILWFLAADLFRRLSYGRILCVVKMVLSIVKTERWLILQCWNLCSWWALAVAPGRFTICSPTLRFSRIVDSQIKLDLEGVLVQKGTEKQNLAVSDKIILFTLWFI